MKQWLAYRGDLAIKYHCSKVGLVLDRDEQSKKILIYYHDEVAWLDDEQYFRWIPLRQKDV
jgi:methyl coenzyme M reductase gamma subunit